MTLVTVRFPTHRRSHQIQNHLMVIRHLMMICCPCPHLMIYLIQNHVT